MSGSNLSTTQKLLRALIFVLLLTAAYLYPFPQANILYPAVVLLHVFGGIVAAFVLGVLLWPLLRQCNFVSKAGWLLLGAGAILGLVLLRTGTPHSEFKWLYAHIIASVAGISCLLAEWIGKRGWVSSNAAVRALVCLAVLVGIGWAAHYQRETRWLSYNLIKNPALPPASMDAEGDGPKGPFFPSSAQVYGGQKIPSKFFMESDSCKRCHEDIYRQWSSSAHTFRHSIISGSASPSSTGRTSSEPSRRNGAADATIPRCCTPAKWIRQSNNSCTVPKPRPDSVA
jgi:hypothetical protein